MTTESSQQVTQDVPEKTARRLGRPSRVTGNLGRLPSREDAPPDAVAGGVDTDLSRTRFGSVRGYAHRQYGETRQDAVKVVQGLDDGVTIVAVADGVGSAAEAARGAQCAVEEACREMLKSRTLSGEWARAVFSEVASAMNKVAASASWRPEDLSTTLAVAMLTEEQAATRVDLALVGDTIPLLLPFEQAEAQPEILETQTAAMPNNFDEVECRSYVVERGQTFVLATDGFANLIRFSSAATDIVDDWVSELPQTLGRFLWDIDAIVKTYDDDRTVFAYQRTQAG